MKNQNEEKNKLSIKQLAESAIQGLKCDISGVCAIASDLISPVLIDNGYSDFYIVEGFVKMPDMINKTQHTWIELMNGSTIDPLFNQFPEGTIYYGIKNKYIPKKHVQSLNDISKYMIDDELKTYLMEVENPFDKGKSTNKSTEKKSTSTDKSMNKDSGASGPGGGEDIFSGADLFSGKDSPDGGGGGLGGGIGGPGGDSSSTPEDEKNSIVNYSKKLQSSKIIKFQKNTPEPGFKFQFGGKFYKDNYVAKTHNGSILLAIPKFYPGENQSKNTSFIQNEVLPKIDETIKNALDQSKRVVIIGYHGLPFSQNTYSNDSQGIIAKALNKKYKHGYLIYDTWSPIEYYAFVGNDDVWSQVQERTQAKKLEIKSALYLYLLTTIEGRKFAKKLKSENVINMIESWNINSSNLDGNDSKSLNKIFSIVYPELAGNPDTLASYIIKTYLQLLRVHLIQKSIKYEKEGKIVVVLSDEKTAWALKPTFDNLNNISKSKDYASSANTSTAPKTAKDEPKNTPPEDSQSAVASQKSPSTSTKPSQLKK